MEYTFNNDLEAIPGEDPFSPEELMAEPGYGPLPLSQAYQIGRAVTRYVIDNVLPRQLLDLGDRLGLRMDRFEGGRREAQPWHFDAPMTFSWRSKVWTGLIAFGRDTGKTDVADPFVVPREPDSTSIANEFIRPFNRVGVGGRSISFRSFPTGTVLISEGPFMHRRGSGFQGTRLALDFSMMDYQEEVSRNYRY